MLLALSTPLWILIAVVVIVICAGCASLFGKIDTEVLAEDLRTLHNTFVEVGPLLVQRGTIKQSEYDITVQATDAALDLFEAWIADHEPASRRAAVRAAIQSAIVKVTVLLLTNEEESTLRVLNVARKPN
jgi:hypothetical protein